MLQQTQVTTVIPYYERFLQRFPTITLLAAASEEEVLHAWEGLGYYRRARQLHAAARNIVTQHDGRFPTTIQQVRELPGIGRYTAGAVLSIGLDQRQPILEANSMRLLCRLLAMTEDPRRQASQQRLWAFAELLLPRRRVGDFNQALMELGNRVCAPRQPSCTQCPVAPLCPTQSAGLQDQIPRPKQKQQVVRVCEAAVVVRAGHKVLLRRCQPGERWEGLWDFPRFPITQTRGKKLIDELETGVAKLTGMTVSLQGTLATMQHCVTRFHITLSCHLATCPAPRRSTKEMRWLDPRDAIDYPLSVTGRKIWTLLTTKSFS